MLILYSLLIFISFFRMSMQLFDFLSFRFLSLVLFLNVYNTVYTTYTSPAFEKHKSGLTWFLLKHVQAKAHGKVRQRQCPKLTFKYYYCNVLLSHAIDLKLERMRLTCELLGT